ncbi:FHA domain-containing protein [Orenia marismortui]|uniref:FHA domain-containing protein n=1 Tax=Orenia marismortui TaxID=46469 RepID=A0A4V3H025_9FIRM|nr:FHA domain-containing protein [Orenia marismortui]TDX58979.1 FHA domain-containing protein [Orenia marismortui]
MSKVLSFLSKILNLINLPKHIKKIFLKRKIRKYTTNNNDSNMILKLFNWLIIITVLSSIVYLNFTYKISRRLLIGELSLGIIICAFLLWKKKKGKKAKTKDPQIKKILLKDQNQNIINTWELRNEVSILIGKKTRVNQVDIDLSEAIYSSLISRQHGVLNKAGNKWYFEDIGSSNGSGIRRRNDSKKIRLAEGSPYQLYSGDILYIANTKLFVQ